MNRAPYWMVRAHLEFLHLIYCEPKKQIGRCSMIVESLPKSLYQEWNRKRKRKKLAGKTERLIRGSRPVEPNLKI